MLKSFNKILTLLKLTTLLVIISQCITVNANSVEELVNTLDYKQVEISPNGKRLAVIYDNDEQIRIYFFETKTMKMIGSHGLHKYSPTNISWVNNERVIMYVLTENVRYAAKFYTGRLYSVNYDGKRGKFLTSVESVIDLMRGDDKNILVNRDDKVYKLNVYNNELSKVANSPIPKTYKRYLADYNGNLKIAHSVDRNRKQLIYLRIKNSKWKELDRINMGEKFRLLRMNKKGDAFYYLDDFNTETLSLFKYDINSSKTEIIFEDKENNVAGIEWDAVTLTPYAVRTEPSYPAYSLIGKSGPNRKVFEKLLEQFPGNRLSIKSESNRGKIKVVKIDNDASPGNYYLYDSKKKLLSPLLQVLEKLDRRKLAYSEPFSFIASDGITINGYISYPNNINKQQKVPLVVLVHGGPIGIRDYWSYDFESQLLNSKGYAVLKVNYRGSGGFGKKFELSGYEQWGTKIQKDIYEATNWAIEQRKVDKDKICIMGSSFGAYSAIQSMTLYPSLYRCGVAYAGVYDLTVLVNEISGDSNRELMSKYVGKNKSKLLSESPNNYVEKIKSPVFLAHGKKDSIAPFEHYEKITEALDDKGINYESMIFDRELHGLNSKNNRVNYYKAVLDFISRSIN